jgi:hypothetical protein
VNKKKSKIYNRVYDTLLRWKHEEIGIQQLLWEIVETADRCVWCETHRACLDAAMNDFFWKEV